MDFRHIILLPLLIFSVLSKKYVSSSDESIENLLYYKDCQQKPKEVPPPPPLPLRESPPPPPKAMECPFPKMCCALSCGDECSRAPTPSMGRPMQSQQNFMPLEPLNGPGMRQQQGVPPLARNRKKKLKQPMRIQMQPPIGGRRDFGFSKDRIKSLINQDDDIRKILKDLVRVTMQKVDLVDMINSHKNANTIKPLEITTRANSVEYDDDDDLE